MHCNTAHNSTEQHRTKNNSLLTNYADGVVGIDVGLKTNRAIDNSQGNETA